MSTVNTTGSGAALKLELEFIPEVYYFVKSQPTSPAEYLTRLVLEDLARHRKGEDQNRGEIRKQTEVMVQKHFAELTGHELTTSTLNRFVLKAKELGLEMVQNALDTCVAKYLRYDADNVTVSESVEEVVNKAFGFIRIHEKRETDPDLGVVRYVIGILRNRFDYYKADVAEEWIRLGIESGVEHEELKRIAAKARNWTDWIATMKDWTMEEDTNSQQS